MYRPRSEARSPLPGVHGRGKAESEDGLTGLVGHVHPPFLAAEFAVDVTQYLTGRSNGLGAHGLHVGKIDPFPIRDVVTVANMEIVSGHQARSMPRRERDVSLSRQRPETVLAIRPI